MGFLRMVSAGMFCLSSWGWGLPHPAHCHIWGSHLCWADGSLSSPALMARGAARSGPVMAIPGCPGEGSGVGPRQPACFYPTRGHAPPFALPCLGEQGGGCLQTREVVGLEGAGVGSGERTWSCSSCCHPLAKAPAFASIIIFFLFLTQLSHLSASEGGSGLWGHFQEQAVQKGQARHVSKELFHPVKHDIRERCKRRKQRMC